MEDTVMKFKDEVKKSKKVGALLRNDIETACAKYDELQSKSFDTEAGYETLEDELKVKLISLIYGNQEELNFYRLKSQKKNLTKNFNLTHERNGMMLKR